MLSSGYAIYSPENGWWGGLDQLTYDDVFGESIVDACVFGSEHRAWENAVAVSGRQDGCGILVYQVTFIRRQVGGAR